MNVLKFCCIFELVLHDDSRDRNMMVLQKRQDFQERKHDFQWEPDTSHVVLEEKSFLAQPLNVQESSADVIFDGRKRFSL